MKVKFKSTVMTSITALAWTTVKMLNLSLKGIFKRINLNNKNSNVFNVINGTKIWRKKKNQILLYRLIQVTEVLDFRPT